jgi:hypothetical protein
VGAVESATGSKLLLVVAPALLVAVTFWLPFELAVAV